MFPVGPRQQPVEGELISTSENALSSPDGKSAKPGALGIKVLKGHMLCSLDVSKCHLIYYCDY